MKQQIEDAEIHFLTKPQFAGIVTNNPYITKVHVLKDNFQDTIEELNFTARTRCIQIQKVKY